MKIKLALLLALVTSAGLLAQDAPKPDAPKGDNPPAKKGEGKGDKGGKKQQGPQRPESVDEATWKKFMDAQKAASSDEAVKAAEAKMKALTKESSPEDRQAAGKALMEARKAAVLKADASLESVFKAIEEARAKGKGKGDKGGKGKKGEGDKGGKKPEAK
jgi:Spy/CpxP family protein refolding chaperone